MSGVTRIALIAGMLFALTLATRVPVAASQLWDWDSVLYARALEDGFHVDYVTARQRPHPPGYILYVATASVARHFTADSKAALVLVSMIATALAAVALFLLARTFASERSSLLVALGFVLNPLVWLYSDVAYPYALLALLSIGLAACFLYARGRGAVAALFASVVFGIVTGFRQDLLLIWAAAWVWTIWPLPWRARAVSAAALLLGCLTWLVPTAALSDGFPAYLNAVARQTEFVQGTHSVLAHGLPALGRNVSATLDAIAWGLGVFVLPALCLVLFGTYRAIRRRAVNVDRTTALVAAWIVPATIVYAAVHIGDPGYVLSILPAFYVIAAIAIDRTPRAVPAAARRSMLAASVVAPALVFTFTSAPFSAASIARHDWELASRVAYVRDHYSPSTTLLIARGDLLLLRYYLPEYRTWFHDRNPHSSTLRRKRAPNVTAIVVLTPGLRTSSAEALRVTCAKGVELVYLAIEPGAVVELRDDEYTVADTPGRR
ncbi:MAG TPA: hypothetical protein VJP45_12990 [Candidatus Limnocylindria bacterium]|nr:hypothetical protein [Candidatus Limnocylindria bacterium]